MLADGNMISIKILSANFYDILNKLVKRGIVIDDVEYIDELTVIINIQRKDYRYTCDILSGSKCQFYVLNRNFKSLFTMGVYRPCLMLAIVLLTFLTIFLPTRVLFLQVDGNENLSDMRIIEEATQAGVRFGMSAADIRSEAIKNSMLEQLPELRWIGVNTSGCVATITVEEKKTIQAHRKPAAIFAASKLPQMASSWTQLQPQEIYYAHKVMLCVKDKC